MEGFTLSNVQDESLSPQFKLFWGLSREFTAAHHYEKSEWSEEQNTKVFGPCFTAKHGHGHNYRIEIWVSAQSQDTDWAKFQLAVQQVAGLLNYKHLPLDAPAFRDRVPTTENIAAFLAQAFRQAYGQDASFLRLDEMSDLAVEIGSRPWDAKRIERATYDVQLAPEASPRELTLEIETNASYEQVADAAIEVLAADCESPGELAIRLAGRWKAPLSMSDASGRHFAVCV